MSFISRIGLALSLMTGLSLSFIAPVVFQTKGAAPLHRLGYANAQTAQTFTDVPADYWAHDYIEGLAKSNVISGFSDGTFKPNDPVTRAQFAAILRQAFLQSQPATAQPFKDVPANYWATGAIASARSAGFLSGYPDNTFKPNDRIVRVQTLVSLANGLKYPAGNSQSLSNYKDAAAVPAYARPSIAAAAQANLIVSYPAPGQISPNRAASRAEVAAFVYQALVKAGRVAPIAARLERGWQITPTITIPAQSYRVSLSENGQRLAAITGQSIGEPGPDIQVWNAQTGSLLKTVTTEALDSVFNAIAISKDGTKIAFIKTTLSTGAIQLTVQTIEDDRVLLTKPLNPPKDQIPKTNYPITPGVLNVVFSPDGKQLVTQVSLSTPGDINQYTIYNRFDFQDIATGKVTQSIDMPLMDGLDIKPILSPDGNLLATPSVLPRRATSSSSVVIWRRNNNRFDPLTALPIGFFGSTMAFTKSNLLTITTSKNYDTWNPQTGERVQSNVLPSEECIQEGDILPGSDGTSYFVGTYPNLGECFGNIQTGEFQRNLDGLSNNLESGVFSGDGNTVAVVGDRQIRIFTKAAP
ncbi:MAG: S-layer homology domain-containing protein [Phormidesmis sp.]